MISVKKFNMDKHHTNSSNVLSSSLSERRDDANCTRSKRLAVTDIFKSDNDLKMQSDNDSINGVDKRESLKTSESDHQKMSQSQMGPDRRVIDRSTFKRLKSKAVVVTAEDRRKVIEDLMADREKLKNESTTRKKKLQSYDTLRTKGKQLAQVSCVRKYHLYTLKHIVQYVQIVRLGLVYVLKLNVNNSLKFNGPYFNSDVSSHF